MSCLYLVVSYLIDWFNQSERYCPVLVLQQGGGQYIERGTLGRRTERSTGIVVITNHDVASST